MFFFFLPSTPVRRLKELADITAGISVTRLATDRQSPRIPVLSISDINEELRPRETLSTAPATSEMTAKFSVQTDDVIVTTRGTDIRAAVVKETHRGTIAGANLAIIRSNGSLVPALLAAFLRQPATQATLLRDTTGASTPGFTIKVLGDLPIRVPPWERQLMMAQMIEAATAYRQATTRALQLRDAAYNEVIARELASPDIPRG
jgi:Type I restriction modification DNA specificity domain